MIDVIEIVFKGSKKYYFKYNDIKIKEGQYVVVETQNGLQIGKALKKKKISKEQLQSALSDVIRIANKEDLEKSKQNGIAAQKAFIKCRELIKKYKLKMKLIDAYYTLDRNQLLIKYTSDERVDFRSLAKDLANIYKTRIELRQIGVRDKAKEVGGCGQCGKELCCAQFLKDFNSVSINMAKNQNIALNPNKINGLCGRLLCCLNYEDETYKVYRKGMPKLGQKIKTKEGEGKVIELEILKRKYKVNIENKEIVECNLDESN